MEDQETLIQALKAKIAQKDLELDALRQERSALSVRLAETGDEVCQLRDEIMELMHQLDRVADVANS